MRGLRHATGRNLVKDIGKLTLALTKADFLVLRCLYVRFPKGFSKHVCLFVYGYSGLHVSEHKRMIALKVNLDTVRFS